MKALVTGGGGFLGRRMVELLREQGHEVSFLARGHYPEVEATGARGIQADLRDRDALAQAVAGQDLVFHVASLTGQNGSKREFWSINVDGTCNLLDVMETAGVPRLVYTSTPSVVGFARDVANGAQDLPYAEEFDGYYPESKAAAEQEVLRANGRHVATVALRPHLIFGPGDNHLIPTIVDRARRGRFFVVGDGTNKVDFTYVDNAAWAHLDAAEALVDHESTCAGRAYFIGNEEPVILYDWLNELLDGLDMPPITRRVSHRTARRLSEALAFLWRTLPLPGGPALTPFVVEALARDHWYDPEPARRDLGYSVRVPMAEATARTIAWLQEVST